MKNWSFWENSPKKKFHGGGGGGTKNRRYCTMYKKVLYNIKKIKKCGGEGEGQYLNPKHSLCI